MYVKGAMGKLTSKLHKNENYTEISLYQIYQPKLHENIKKFYRLNLFKEIAIGFNNGLQTTSESPLAFPTVSLSKLVNAGSILAFRSSLVLNGDLLVSH